MNFKKNRRLGFLFGLPGTGQGSLRILLDGGLDCLVIPFQGFGCEFLSSKVDRSFSSRSFGSWSRRDRGVYRSIIINETSVSYGDLIRIHSPSLSMLADLAISQRIFAGPENTEEETEFLFDFEQYCEGLKKLFERNKIDYDGKWTWGFVYRYCLEIFVRCWLSKPEVVHDDFMILNSMHNGSDVLTGVMASFSRSENVRGIAILRDVPGMAYTYLLRLERKKARRFDSFELHLRFLLTLTNTNFRSRLNDFRASAINYGVETVNFSDMVFDTRNTLKAVAKNLGVSWDEAIYTTPSLGGSILEGSYVGQVQDSPADRLHPLLLKFLHTEGS